MTVQRGTTNGNQRGSSYSRAARRAFLLATYAADVQVLQITWEPGHVGRYYPSSREDQAERMARLDQPALDDDWAQAATSYTLLATCRCFRCGTLLTDGTLTVDRIIPGCEGGTYRRNNIRPACGPCNSETGGALARRGKAKR